MCELPPDSSDFFIDKFHTSAIIEVMAAKDLDKTARFADMLVAMGTEPRLRIIRLLLSAHPEGMVVGDIQAELGILPSTLSHHLEKLKNEGLVNVRRESTYLWYSANTEGLRELLTFLYAECCTRNKVITPEEIVRLCK
jgi:DNA-binding transcriptional ArsR family regulator